MQWRKKAPFGLEAEFYCLYFPLALLPGRNNCAEETCRRLHRKSAHFCHCCVPYRITAIYIGWFYPRAVSQRKPLQIEVSDLFFLLLRQGETIWVRLLKTGLRVWGLLNLFENEIEVCRLWISVLSQSREGTGLTGLVLVSLDWLRIESLDPQSQSSILKNRPLISSTRQEFPPLQNPHFKAVFLAASLSPPQKPFYFICKA